MKIQVPIPSVTMETLAGLSEILTNLLLLVLLVSLLKVWLNPLSGV